MVYESSSSSLGSFGKSAKEILPQSADIGVVLLKQSRGLTMPYVESSSFICFDSRRIAALALHLACLRWICESIVIVTALHGDEYYM